mgnify:CR=1 FL=1
MPVTVKCKGKIENKLTNYIADLGKTIIIVKDVPSQVCQQCGEVSYSDEVARKLEQIVASLQEQRMEIAITHYSSDNAA